MEKERAAEWPSAWVVLGWDGISDITELVSYSGNFLKFSRDFFFIFYFVFYYYGRSIYSVDTMVCLFLEINGKRGINEIYIYITREDVGQTFFSYFWIFFFLSLLFPTDMFVDAACPTYYVQKKSSKYFITIPYIIFFSTKRMLMN